MTKKYLITAAVTLLTFGCLSTVHAEGSDPNSEWVYDYLGNGAITVLDHDGDIDELHIPEFIDDGTVSGIGDPKANTNEPSHSFHAAVGTLHIPKTVSEIYPAALTAAGIHDFSVDEESPYFSSVDGILYDKAGTTLIAYPSGRAETSFTVPEGTIAVGNRAFFDNEVLQEIILSDSVKTIEEYAFMSCDNLQHVDFGAVTTIERGAFQVCSSLSPADISDKIEVIGDYAFFRNAAVNEITIPASVTSVGAKAFGGCQVSAFIVDPQNQMLVSADGVLLSKDGKTFIQLPDAKQITSFTVPDGVETISRYAFADNPYIQEIILPDSVTGIEGGAFSACQNLLKVQIPDSVASIGTGLFQRSDLLEEFNIPASVDSLAEDFFRNTVIKKVTVKDDHPRYEVTDDILYDKIDQKLVYYFGNGSEYTIPSSVQVLAAYSFNGHPELLRLIIPDTVAKIQPLSLNLTESTTFVVNKESDAGQYIQKAGLANQVAFSE